MLVSTHSSVFNLLNSSAHCSAPNQTPTRNASKLAFHIVLRIITLLWRTRLGNGSFPSNFHSVDVLMTVIWILWCSFRKKSIPIRKVWVRSLCLHCGDPDERRRMDDLYWFGRHLFARKYFRIMSEIKTSVDRQKSSLSNHAECEVSGLQLLTWSRNSRLQYRTVKVCSEYFHLGNVPRGWGPGRGGRLTPAHQLIRLICPVYLIRPAHRSSWTDVAVQ